MDPGLHGGDARPHDLRDGLVGEVLLHEEEDGGALLLGEPGDGQAEGLLDVGDLALGTVREVAGLGRVVEGGGGLPGAATTLVEQEVVGDVEEVGRELGLGAPAGRRAVEADEDLEGELLRGREAAELSLLCVAPVNPKVGKLKAQR